MRHMIVIRVFELSDGSSTMEFALGRMGEYPRVIFRGTGGPYPPMSSRTEVRDLMESVAEELFNFAAYADRQLDELPDASSLGSSESSWQLVIPGTLDGGGRGGPAGDGQPGEA